MAAQFREKRGAAGFLRRWVSMLLWALLWPLLGDASAGQETRDLSAHFGSATGAFVCYDAGRDHWLRYQPELCRARSSPCSTFKIPNTLIALETGVADGPNFTLPWDGKSRFLADWNRDQSLRSAYAVSCVWYYQELARRIGQKPMEAALTRWDYGNRDTSGGLTQFWLSSSLKISPDEQVDFLRRLHTRQLPVSEKSVNILLDIMVVGRVGDTVYRGKTGSAMDEKSGKFVSGWWVGSVVGPQGSHFFATWLRGGDSPSGREARRMTGIILQDLGVLPRDFPLATP